MDEKTFEYMKERAGTYAKYKENMKKLYDVSKTLNVDGCCRLAINDYSLQYYIAKDRQESLAEKIRLLIAEEIENIDNKMEEI